MHLASDRLPGAGKLSYEDAIAFWFGCINYEKRAPQPDDLKLEPMKLLLARLGNPERHIRIIHVAGSKGKGSTAAMLAAILRQAGYRTGLFTSPHLCRVEERIQVDGQPISPDEGTSVLSDVAKSVQRLDPFAASQDRSSAPFVEAAGWGA